MPAYGYSKAIVNEYGLHELSEVSLAVPIAGLRKIAAFLNECADRLESGEWRSSHLHIEQPWNDCNVMVLNPDPDPPLNLTSDP